MISGALKTSHIKTGVKKKEEAAKRYTLRHAGCLHGCLTIQTRNGVEWVVIKVVHVCGKKNSPIFINCTKQDNETVVVSAESRKLKTSGRSNSSFQSREKKKQQ